MEFLGIPPHVAFTLLTWYSSLIDTANNGVILSKRIIAAVLSVFERRAFYFFRDQAWYPTPIPIHSVNVKASTSAAVDWIYYPDSKQFMCYPYPTEAAEEVTTKQRVPFLSIEIVGTDGRVMFDLTDFMEGLWIYNDAQLPRSFTLWHVIQAWTLSSGILPDIQRIAEIRVITDSGDVESRSIFEGCMEDLFRAEDAADAPAAQREDQVLAQLREEERRTAERNEARRVAASAARMEAVD
jgi:hypothetical protein